MSYEPYKKSSRAMESSVAVQVNRCSNVQVQTEKVLEDVNPHSSEKNYPSVMRHFLDSEEDFRWPPEVGSMEDYRCIFHPEIQKKREIPLERIRPISDKSAATIEAFRVSRKYPYKFQKAFVVKTPRTDKPESSRIKAAMEVSNHSGLRHPHISALLSAYEFQARLSIMIFPVARCDLEQFMKVMSMRITAQNPPDEEIREKILYRWDGGDSTENPTGLSSQNSSPDGTNHPKMASAFQEKKPDIWPINIELPEMKLFLRRHFVCLCQALNYLHEANVRHKDIKPANILLDSSGSCILTDFGISRRFAEDEPHITSDERKYTRKYASPEMMSIQSTSRDDPSDVFSLGLVFLEMTTVILGYGHPRLSKYCFYGLNQMETQEEYHSNLRNVYKWIDFMKNSQGTQVGNSATSSDRIVNRGPIYNPDEALTQSLSHIRSMLDKSPGKRPKAKDLWWRFQSICPDQCEDCDPRHPNVWRPSKKQQEIDESGLKRRSLMSQESLFRPDPSCRRQSLARKPSAEIEKGRRPTSPSALGNYSTPIGPDILFEMDEPEDTSESSTSFSKLAPSQGTPMSQVQESAQLHPDGNGAIGAAHATAHANGPKPQGLSPLTLH